MAYLRIDLNNEALSIINDDTVRGVFHQHAVLAFAITQGFFCPAPLGNVADDAEAAYHLARWTAKGGITSLEEAFLSCLGNDEGPIAADCCPARERFPKEVVFSSLFQKGEDL